MAAHKASRARGRSIPSPLCLRVSVEERRFLEARSREGGHPSVSAYIRTRLFGMIRAESAGAPPLGRLSAVDRQRLLAQILGMLGASKALSNLTGLTEVARMGALPLTPEVISDIRSVCAAVIDARDLLLRALGIRPTAGRGDDR